MSRTVVDNVILKIDSNDYKKDGVSVDTSSNSFVVEISPPIERVKEIKIESLVFNNGIYNVNDDEISIQIEVNVYIGIGGGRGNYNNKALIEQGNKTHSDSFADDVSNSMPHPISSMTGNFNIIDENRYMFNTDDNGDNLVDIIWYYSEVLNKLGAVDNILFYMSFISKEKLAVSEPIIIDETNDTLILRSRSGLTSLTSSYTLQLKHTNYTIHNIVYEINKFIKANGLNTDDKNTKDVEYYAFSDKIVIRTNKKSGSSNSYVSSKQWYIEDTPLSQLLKLDDTLSNWVYISDVAVDPDVQFELLDYTTFSSNRNGNLHKATIPVGAYQSVDSIIDAVNTSLSTTLPAPVYPYTLQYDSLTKKTILNLGTQLTVTTIYRTGLALLLGLTSEGNMYIPEGNDIYPMSNISVLHKKYLFIKSNTISRLKGIASKSNIIYNIPLSLDNVIYDTNISQQKIIFPSVRTIDEIDFTILQDEYKIANNNGGDYAIILNLIIM